MKKKKEINALQAQAKQETILEANRVKELKLIESRNKIEETINNADVRLRN